MNLLKTGYYICLRTWKKLYYRPIHLVFSFIQPIFWLTIFGFLFQDKFDLGEASYLSYLLPGVCAMTVIQSSSQSGILFIKDFQTEFFGRYNFTPISKIQFLFFKIFADFARIFFQVLIIILIGFSIGVESINISILGFFKLFAGTFLFTFFYASISSFIAIKTKVSELMATFVNLFNLPIIFTSTALVPNKGLPSWLGNVAKFNPLSHLSDIFRSSIIGVDFNSNLEGNSFLILAVLMLISFICTTIYFKNIRYN